METGNFAPTINSVADSVKARAFADFYRDQHYDGIALSTREMSAGLALWQAAAADGAPILAANLFDNAPPRKRGFFSRLFGRKPQPQTPFQQYVIRESLGDRLAVIGFISDTAWRARKDTTAAYTYVSPYDMGDLIARVADKCDHLTVIGEFSSLEADSLVKRYPAIDLVASSGIRTDHVVRVGNSLIAGVSTRGYYGNYIDWNLAATDTMLDYNSQTRVLDESLANDSSAVRLISGIHDRVQKAGQH